MIKKLIRSTLLPILSKLLRNDTFDKMPTIRDLQTVFNKTEGMINFEEGILLYELAKQAKGECIVEVGAYRGRSAVMLASGSLAGNNLPVYSIEPHEPFVGILGGEFGGPDRGAFYQAMLDTSLFHIVRLVNLSSEIVTVGWQKKVGFLWIDGDHSYVGVKRDFECWLPFLTSDTLIAFDDSTNLEIGPARLIKELISSGKFKVENEVRHISVLKKI